MLHSTATGNLLAASDPLVRVDVDSAMVTERADRGRALGPFLGQLAREPAPET